MKNKSNTTILSPSYIQKILKRIKEGLSRRNKSQQCKLFKTSRKKRKNNIFDIDIDVNEKNTLNNRNVNVYTANNKDSLYKYDILAKFIEKKFKESKQRYNAQRTKLNIAIAYNIFNCMLALISVILYIVSTASLTPVRDITLYLDFAISNIFLIVLILNFIMAKNKVSFFASLYPWIDIVSILASYVGIIILHLSKFQLSFIRILRLLKILEIGNLVQLLKSLDLRGESIHYSSSPKTDSFAKFRKQLFKLIIYLASIIVISAGVVQQISVFHHKSFSESIANFINAFYFIIITLTTVGTGDIVPTKIYTRFLMLLLIMGLAYFVTLQITRIVSLLKMARKAHTHFKFTNHIIIFGGISKENLSQIHLINFLEELYSELLTDNKILFKENVEYSDKISCPNCIIISVDDENEEDTKKEIYLKLSRIPLYGLKIFHLSIKKYDYDVFDRANFKSAKNIFCINNEINSKYWITDKIISFYLKNLETINAKSIQENCSGGRYIGEKKETKKCIHFKKLYVQYLFHEKGPQNLIHKDIFTQISIPRMRLKYSIIAKNIFVNGWVTLLTNLFNVHRVFVNKTENYYLNHYLYGLNQSLSTYKLPKCFRNKSFSECTKIIYALSVEYKINLIKGINYGHEYTDKERENISEVLLTGIMSLEDIEKLINGDAEKITKECEKCRDERRNNSSIVEDMKIGLLIKRVQYNPQKYIILDKYIEYGIFISSDYINYEDFFKFVEMKLKIHSQLNDKFIEKFYCLDEFSKNEIAVSTEGIILNDNEPESINVRNSPYFKEDRIASHLHNYFTNIYGIHTKFLKELYNRYLLTDYTHRYKNHSMFVIGSSKPLKILNQHILVFGWSYYIEHLIYKIRIHSIHNTIVVISEDIPQNDDKTKNLLNKFKNLFLIKGDYLDMNNLMNLEVWRAFYAIIIPSKNEKTMNEDSHSILVARILERYFKIPYLIEIAEDKNAKFIGSLPIVKEEATGSIIDSNYTPIYPNFACGKIFFNSVLDKLMARSFKNNFQAICFKNLIESDFKSNVKKIKTSIAQSTLKDVDNFETKIYLETSVRIFSFPLDNFYEGKPYKYLLSELFSVGSIPLAIYNKRYKKVKRDYNENKFYHNDQLWNKIPIDKLVQIPTTNFEPTSTTIERSNPSNIYSTHNHTVKNDNSCLEVENKLKKMRKILRNELNEHVDEQIPLDEICTPLVITNPSNDMLLNSDMEVIVIGDFNKLLEGSPNLVSKKHLNTNKTVSTMSKNIYRLTKFKEKAEEIKKVIKNLEKKLSKVKMVEDLPEVTKEFDYPSDSDNSESNNQDSK